MKEETTKDKAAAVKLLLDNGWTLDEVLGVLDANESIINDSTSTFSSPVQSTQFWWLDYTRPRVFLSGSFFTPRAKNQ